MEIGNREKIGIALVAILVLVSSCGGLYLLLTVDGLAANLRDLLVIVLAFEFIVIASAMLFMVWQLYQLIMLLRNEILPLIHTTKDTVEQVKHTTTFIGQSVAHNKSSDPWWCNSGNIGSPNNTIRTGSIY